MKRFLYVLLAACLMLLVTGCTVQKAQSSQPSQGAQVANTAQTAGAAQAGSTSEVSANSDVIELTENMYVTYINEIYTNFDDYIGRTIKLQGMFTSEYYEPSDTTYYYVYRVGPGCCGNDGSMCGFEFTWDGQMPQDNDWIEVIGTLDKYDLEGQTYLTLNAKSVQVMTERGTENVYR